MCSICKRDGHLKDECPEDFKKIELKPLPPMTERFREILDGLCRLCYCKTAARPFHNTLWRKCLLVVLIAAALNLCCVCVQSNCRPHMLSSRRGSRSLLVWSVSLGRSTMVSSPHRPSTVRRLWLILTVTYRSVCVCDPGDALFLHLSRLLCLS